ncbi:cue domain-containing protein [Ophiostoma piceae UAMH 11346]|uniref:Cue domain-containing protein n=1 Tax=Ophiostoma piceae (strain UAMH 11346) TaxID=1262450 RepID=S3CRC3_OPHP1|nr:cue domain-containing protein [Ophiostoma piceae UAMH 11346]
MDDDDVQDASISLDDATTPVKPTASATTAASGEAAASGTTTPTTAANAALKTTVEDEAAAPAAEEPAPPKPPRPLTEQQKNEQTLKEAFPTVDFAVVKAVLTASRGNIEAAFHALLEMTDPNAVAQEPEENEPAPPPQPPRPSANLQAGAKAGGRLSPNSQLLADEEYARQLAQHYENEAGQYEARTSSGRYGGGRSAHGGPPYPPRSSSSRGESLKPSDMWGDKDHSFLDDDLPVIPPVRNPNLFRPPPSTSPRPGSERKVAFSDNNETIDMYGASPKLPPKDGPAAGGAAAAASTGAKASKWQPMSAVDPAPLADNDDPFSLGDSEDEKDTTTASKPAASKSDSSAAAAKTSTSPTPTDEAERLRKAAAEAMADSLVEDKPKA